ncbi:aspartate/glutamate racemase family protein [Rhodococcus erythropolis]|uniref:aspartate/glutamate racemase family protein n=1 Tax=Rhodococcus erythropolis TaxID=1833 RepID=UPI00294A67DF|nr:aspartate/glutamate racemase family protein [Rhodococcus erythropolis]MDV6277188.1 aspartate/glutamate racemase family protein [Rhodococcus erythropolis]
MDGVFITCFVDPRVQAAREIVDAPVVGGFEPSFLTAMSLGDRVGVVTILPNVVPMLRSLGGTGWTIGWSVFESWTCRCWAFPIGRN